MTFKRFTSMLLALTMVLGLLGSGIFVSHADAAGEEPTLHIAGAISSSTSSKEAFYLFADVVDGMETKRMVYYRGIGVGQTNSGEGTAGFHSLGTKEYPDSNGTTLAIYVKDERYAEWGPNCFFIMTGRTDSGTATMIYAHDELNDGDWDTGSTKAFNSWKNALTWDVERGQVHQKVPTASAGVYDDYVLVCSKLAAGTNGDLWRMYFKLATEVDTTKDYYVKLGQMVACTFGTEWKSDGSSHWHECSCGAKSDEAAHDTEGAEWKTDDNRHWKVCNICGAKATPEDHTWGDWTYGTDTQSRTCGKCDYVQTTEKHPCAPAADALYESDGTHHWKLCETCNQPVESTKAEHTPKEDLVKDPANEEHADEHWQICSVCDAAYGYAKHTFEGEYSSDENDHWQKCACGLESAHAPHEVSKWTVVTEATETTAGRETGECSACKKSLSREIPPRIKDGNYYLTGVLNGVTVYFRTTGTGESVAQTLPYSLCTTNDIAAATSVAITLDEATNSYTISYFTTKILYLYINDEKFEGAYDQVIDTGVTGSQSAARTPFFWDPESKVLYQMEGDVKYVLAFKTMTNTKTNAQEVRLVGVPETELSSSVVAAKLEMIHEHAYGESWESDAVGHWHVCACGSKKDEADHTVSEWTVEKEATETDAGSKTGKCDVCGATVKATVPATGVVIEPPKNGDVRYLSAEINGVRYFFRHTVSGETVTSTTPYSLYATTKVADANAITVSAADGVYTLSYSAGGKNLRLYINASGVGVTAKDDASLINFSWDPENNVLYQMEGDVKYVLVFKPMDNTKTGEKELRITAMPLREALSDSNVRIVELATDSSANTGDNSVTGMMAVVMVLSVCAMGAIVATKKKWS